MCFFFSISQIFIFSKLHVGSGPETYNYQLEWLNTVGPRLSEHYE